MTDSESTIKFAIFDAIVSNWHKKNDHEFAEVVRDKVFEKIFEPHLKWAIEEYLEELKQQKP